MTLDLKALKKEAARGSTSPTRLRELAQLSVELSRVIAKSEHTPIEILKDLAKSSDMPTRAAIAKHPNTTTTILDYLAGDKQWTVLKSVAVHPAVSDQTLTQLASHKQSTVRLAVAWKYRNKTRPLPAGVIQTLALDENLEVREEIFVYNLYSGLTAISEATVEKLVFHSDFDIRLHISQSNNLIFSRSQLERLIQDQSVEIRRNIASSSSFVMPAFKRDDLDLLEFMLKDKDKVVRQNAHDNISTLVNRGLIPRK